LEQHEPEAAIRLSDAGMTAFLLLDGFGALMK
jgi:hypothetical protein